VGKRIGDHVKASEILAVIEIMTTVQLSDSPSDIGLSPHAIEMKAVGAGTLTEVVIELNAEIHPGDLLGRMKCD
jgi:biotin carboxyl carrier protein